MDTMVRLAMLPHHPSLIDPNTFRLQAIAHGPAMQPGTEPDLGMRILLVHGDEVIADSKESGVLAACSKFKAWVRKHYFNEN